MAQFRTTADLMDTILRKAGELTDGTSDYETSALEYINRVHQTLVAGGSIFETNIDEAWEWAIKPDPIIIELQPKYDTGSVSVTNGSESGSFSAAVTNSLQGWYLQIDGKDEIYKIISHSAGGTAFELDSAYTDTTDATAGYKAFKLDYEIVPTYLYINSENNKIDFYETDGSELTATLSAGAYTPAQLATEVDTQLTAAGASAYTISYDSLTRKFTILSDGNGGGGILSLLPASGSNAANSALKTMRFNQVDKTGALTYTSDSPIGSISKLIEPFHIYKGENDIGNCFGIDKLTMQVDYPMTRVTEGYPDKFTVIRELSEGRIWVRFNKYPKEATRMAIDHVEIPLDLQDNAVSIPMLPRKYNSVLEDGPLYYLLLEKEDSKAATYLQLAQRTIMAMKNDYKARLSRTGENFGAIIPRRDQLNIGRRKLRYGEPTS